MSWCKGINAGTFTNLVYSRTRTWRTASIRAWSSSHATSFHAELDRQRPLHAAAARTTATTRARTTNQPGKTSFIGNYPEAFNAARNFPDGRLQDFQRSRLRSGASTTSHLGEFGDLSPCPVSGELDSAPRLQPGRNGSAS